MHLYNDQRTEKPLETKIDCLSFNLSLPAHTPVSTGHKLDLAIVLLLWLDESYRVAPIIQLQQLSYSVQSTVATKPATKVWVACEMFSAKQKVTTVTLRQHTAQPTGLGGYCFKLSSNLSSRLGNLQPAHAHVYKRHPAPSSHAARSMLTTAAIELHDDCH